MSAEAADYTEAPAWEAIDGQWRQLYGSFHQQGISIEWHEFSTDRELDWSKSFHRDSLEICLNFSGQGRLDYKRRHSEIGPQQVGIYASGEELPQATRASGSLHRFATFELSVGYLRQHLGPMLESLQSEVRRFVEQPKGAKPLIEVKPMTSRLETLRSHLLEPPFNAAAQALWYQSKILEVLAQTVFHETPAGELFCDRQKRQNRERAERVRYLLMRDLENPPSLDMLAHEVGCSAFHLSRIFTAETGQSIPQYLRSVRIERAAELLKSGRCNVTEAAMQVGYSSLSAFNKAFVEQIGCCPGLYPVLRK